MGFSCGIVGLPNVGKSTLFNALTKQNAANENYPFCTIDPNIGTVPIPDDRMDQILKYVKTNKVIPSFMNFTDIAGLVKGASEGQGLGNKFLSHIKEVQAIAHVVRLFPTKEIIDIGDIDPICDFDIIMTELRLKDLESIENKKKRLLKDVKLGIKGKKEEALFVEKIAQYIEEEKALFNIGNLNDKEKEYLKSYFLLTSKPQIIIANVSNTQFTSIDKEPLYKKLQEYAQKENIEVVPISAQIENEIATLTLEESKDYLETFGIDKSALSTIVQKGHKLLNLISFYTIGEQECRAWNIKNGLSAQKAAGKIHTDFEKGFIRAEIVSYDDFMDAKCSYQKVKENGKLRLEGKEYIIKDGDIVHFRFNV